MGASAREIERQIKETRERMDDNLTQLEGSAASKAIRYGKVAALAAGVVVVAGVAFVIYRQTHKPTLRDRLEDLSADDLRAMVKKLSARLKDEVPSVTVTLNDKPVRQPGIVEGMVRKVAPAVVGTASTALLERFARPREVGARNARAQAG